MAYISNNPELNATEAAMNRLKKQLARDVRKFNQTPSVEVKAAIDGATIRILAMNRIVEEIYSQEMEPYKTGWTAADTALTEWARSQSEATSTGAEAFMRALRVKHSGDDPHSQGVQDACDHYLKHGRLEPWGGR